MIYEIDDLIPHRPPMSLLTRIVAIDTVTNVLTAHVTITSDAVFFDHHVRGVPNHIAIEYMAQAAAALVGAEDRATTPSRTPLPGLLLGTRALTLAEDYFLEGRTYVITAMHVFSSGETAAFECTITYAGTTIAQAVINAYRPSNIDQFIKEQTAV